MPAHTSAAPYPTPNVRRLTSSLRPHVLPRRARQRDGHRTARRARRRSRRQRDLRAPPPLPLLLAPRRVHAAQQAVARAVVRVRRRRCRHHPVRSPDNHAIPILWIRWVFLRMGHRRHRPILPPGPCFLGIFVLLSLAPVYVYLYFILRCIHPTLPCGPS